MEVAQALEAAWFKGSVVSIDSRRGENVAEDVIAQVLVSVRKARAHARHAYCLSAAARLEQILQSFSNCSSDGELSKLNMDLRKPSTPSSLATPRVASIPMAPATKWRPRLDHVCIEGPIDFMLDNELASASCE